METDGRQIEEAALSLDELGEEEADALRAAEAERRDAEMDEDEHLGRSAEEVLRDIRANVR